MAVVITSHVEGLDKQLSGEPAHRRPAGAVVSPLTYTNDLVNFDHWDHMFMTNCCHGLTLHSFDRPPATVLDLGCGRGLWAIEAVKQWQGSTVVGFDVQPVQPKLHLLHKNLSRRLKWIHGNLLDGLPFLDGQFDLVRMVRMGLHIPEDEWGYVLKEISRVLSPSGVFEIKIIEEDLIFPFQPPPYSSVTPTSRQSSGDSSLSSTVVSSHIPSTRSDPSIAGTGSSLSSLSLAMCGVDFKCPLPPDPRDHSRLRRAWEEMLSESFLTPNLVSVIPFHLGAWFHDIQTHSPFEVPLPPSSSRKRLAQPSAGPSDLINPDAVFELRALSSTMLSESDDDSRSSPVHKISHRTVSLFAPMHLARSVRIIVACKESIWHAYKKLYGRDPSIPSLVRSSQEKYLKKHFDQAQSTANPLRDYFERDWTNWESDMADRIYVRGSIRSELCWKEPFGLTPEWRAWFNSLPPCDENECEERLELCRRLRGFVCFKGGMATTNRGVR